VVILLHPHVDEAVAAAILLHHYVDGPIAAMIFLYQYVDGPIGAMILLHPHVDGTIVAMISRYSRKIEAIWSLKPHLRRDPARPGERTHGRAWCGFAPAGSTAEGPGKAM